MALSNSLRQRRSGFTLIELLVVIAIIGVLVGLTLPAVQKVRESANRTKCSNNLRQIALAVIGYESKWNKIPYSRTGQAFDPQTGLATFITTWAVDILPDLEQDTLYQAFYGQNPRFNGISQSIGVKTFICPSRRKDTQEGLIAVGDYAGNGGQPQPVNNVFHRNDAFFGNTATNQILSGPFVQGPGMPQGFTGELIYTRKVSFSDIKDGTGNTLLVAEKFVPRAGFGQALHDCSIFDGTSNATQLCAIRNGGNGFNIQPFDTINSTFPAWGSAHDGGLNVAMCDGSVRFVSAIALDNALAGYSSIAGREVAANLD